MKKTSKISLLLAAIMVAFLMSSIKAYAIETNGIDISSHNGYVDYNSVKASNISYVYIKATEGVDWQDYSYNRNYLGAKAAGLKVGFYHFFSNYTSPTEQAIDFYNTIKDKPYDLLPCLDIETNRLEVGKTEMSNRALEFLQEFEKLSGQRCVVYTGSYFGQDLLDYRVYQYPLWIAHYKNWGSPRIPSGWKNNYVGWQFSENGSINGINGDVDLNEFSDGVLINNTKRNIVQVYNNESINIYQQLQEELNRQGFTDWNGNSLNEDGIPGKLTLSACPIVREGAKGKVTQWIQLRVGVKPDGVFGENTKNAVKYFQGHHGLSADGIVGICTWKALL